MRRIDRVSVWLAVGMFAMGAVADDGAEAAGSAQTEGRAGTKIIAPPVYKLKGEGTSAKIEVVDVGVFQGYRYDRKNGAQEATVLDAKLATLVEARQDGNESSSLRLVSAPFVSLIESRQSGGESSFDLIDVPFFSVIKAREHGNGDFDRRFLNLPIIGSLFRHSKDGDTETVRILGLKVKKHGSTKQAKEQVARNATDTAAEEGAEASK